MACVAASVVEASPRMTQDDDEDEPFQDAVEDVLPLPITTGIMDLGTAVRETQIALNLFLNNRFELAEARMEPWAKYSMYHALGYSTVLYIKAMMTCNPKDIEIAVERCKLACTVCDRFRKQTSISGTVTKHVTKLVRMEKPSGFTDEEMHAELCYAECLLQRAMLTFVQDENLVSFVKGALKIRNCYQSYKECERILQKESFGSKDRRLLAHFESGVRMGIGTFNLMISVLPPRILRLLEVVGFTGNKTTGLTQLIAGADMRDCLRAPLCSLVLMSWHLVAVYLLGTGHGDLKLCQKLLKPMLDNFPKGALVLYFAGRLNLVTANLKSGLDYLQKSIDAQLEMRQFHHLCYWEMMFAHAFLQKWQQAAQYASILYKENNWSPATYAYLTATFRLACKQYHLSSCERNEMEDFFRRIPSMKQRIAGKSLPVEKFCAIKAQRYTNKGSLLFAHYELIYMWNGFQIIGLDENLVKNILNDVQNQLQSENEKDLDWDDRALCLLLKGTCLRHLQSPFQAEECFFTIINCGMDLGHHSYTIPSAYFELAVMAAETKNVIKAAEYLNKVKMYKGYLLESRLHFRVHNLRDALGVPITTP